MINLNQEVQRLASTGKVSAESADMLHQLVCLNFVIESIGTAKS